MVRQPQRVGRGRCTNGRTTDKVPYGSTVTIRMLTLQKKKNKWHTIYIAIPLEISWKVHGAMLNINDCLRQKYFIKATLRKTTPPKSSGIPFSVTSYKYLHVHAP